MIGWSFNDQHAHMPAAILPRDDRDGPGRARGTLQERDPGDSLHCAGAARSHEP